MKVMMRILFVFFFLILTIVLGLVSFYLIGIGFNTASDIIRMVAFVNKTLKMVITVSLKADVRLTHACSPILLYLSHRNHSGPPILVRILVKFALGEMGGVLVKSEKSW